VTLDVTIPPGFAAADSAKVVSVKHTRVDEMHGDAFTVWASRGSPQVPSAEDLAALRGAMEPVVLSREQLSALDTTIRVSFELPRFGVSLIELEPSDARRDVTPSSSRSGCSLLAASSAQGASLSSCAPLASLAVGAALLRRRSRARRQRWTRS
jgi:hypothetical protein